MSMVAQESQEALLRREQRKEAKLNASRQQTHSRLGGLLSSGAGIELVSEPTGKEKMKLRSATSDDSVFRFSDDNKPNTVRRPYSEEDLSSSQAKPPKPANTVRKIDRSLPDTLGDEFSGNSLESFKPARSSTVKKKTKKRRSEEEGTNEYGSEGQDNTGYERGSFEDDLADRTKPGDSSAGKNVKAKTSSVSLSKEEAVADRFVRALEKKKSDDGRLLCVVVHKTDQLKPDILVSHPVVRVHLVNADSGQYVKKADKSRNVVSIFENKNENVDYILPTMTQPYEFKKWRSVVPMWEESIVYNEMYSYFLQRDEGHPPIIVFFEVLDFVSVNALRGRELSKTDKGWHRVAWAFLKLVSPTGCTNTDHKLRLQLYYPVTRPVQTEDNAGMEIYQWWKYASRMKYPSTLYVTVKGIHPPQSISPRKRSMFALQEERGGSTYEDLHTTVEGQHATDAGGDGKESALWQKLPGQVNRIPNKQDLALATGRNGCSVVRFSCDGRYLACACATSDSFPIVLYEFPAGKLVSSFSSHFGIVYDLCWSDNGRELLSASGDCSVRCWDTKRYTSSAIKVLPHPSFVYVARYHPKMQTLVLTGSFDKIIRIWNKLSEDYHASLLRELPNHGGYVNSLAFGPDGSHFFSGDSEGVVIQWYCGVEVEGKKKSIGVEDKVKDWKVVKTLEFPEVKNVAISTLQVHPGGRKLLLHARDSLLRMLDLRSYSIMKRYSGGSNAKEHIRSTFSKCGSFIFCGTEDGLLHVWNTETGDLVHTYTDMDYTKSVSDVCFHPHDNFLVICCYGDGQPVLIYKYDPTVLQTSRRAEGTHLSDSSGLPSKSLRDSQPDVSFFKASTTSEPKEANRMESVVRKLDSVLLGSANDNLTSTRSRVTFREDSFDVVAPRRKTTSELQDLSTWGSDFSSMLSSPSTIAGRPPSSPHAQLHLGSSGFASRHGILRGSSLVNPPAGSIEMNLEGTPSTLQASKPTFTFNSPNSSRREAMHPRKVVALYEYQPARADELWIHPNDEISVLYEDSPNWWLGQLKDGRQGYFPVNYVMEPESGPWAMEKDSLGGLKSDASSHSAVIGKDGELKIISGAEDSDVDAPRTRKLKRKEKRQRSSLVTATTDA